MQVNDIYSADTCKIVPAKFSGSKEIVSLHFRKLVSDLTFKYAFQEKIAVLSGKRIYNPNKITNFVRSN